MSLPLTQVKLLTDIAIGADYRCSYRLGRHRVSRNTLREDGRSYRSLEALKAKGLIEFELFIRQDRWGSNVSLTEAGRDALARLS